MGLSGLGHLAKAIMGRTLLEQGDNLSVPGFTLPGTGSLAITFNDTGTSGLTLDFLVLSGTPSVSIASAGAAGGSNFLGQLDDTTNNLTTVTLSGSESFVLGLATFHANTGDGVVTDIDATAASPTTIHSSLTLINASATTGGVAIFASATNTSGAGHFQNGGNLNANITITYTGLRSRAARALMLLRTTPRTVSSSMATATRTAFQNKRRRGAYRIEGRAG